MIRFAGGNGISLAADQAGTPGAPSVVLLHGGGQTRHSWGRAVKALGSAGFHAISLDLRGHGDSEWAADGDYSLEAIAADIRAVTATLPDRPALVGASLGGLAALLAAGDGEAIARALVLVDVVPRIEMAGATEIRDFMTGNPDGFASLDAAADTIAAYLPHRRRRSGTSGLAKNLRLRDDGRYYWHWDPRMLESRRSQLSGDRGLDELHNRLELVAQNLSIPTLLIRGGNSRIVSLEGAAAFGRMIRHGEFVNIADADHMVAGDANDAFNTPLLDFLARHR